MVVVVEVVDIDLAHFEMARDKLTERSLTWKKSGAKANLAARGWRSERVSDGANPRAVAIHPVRSMEKVPPVLIPGMVYGAW